jgi:hypothetical protein
MNSEVILGMPFFEFFRPKFVWEKRVLQLPSWKGGFCEVQCICDANEQLQCNSGLLPDLSFDNDALEVAVNSDWCSSSSDKHISSLQVMTDWTRARLLSSDLDLPSSSPFAGLQSLESLPSAGVDSRVLRVLAEFEDVFGELPSGLPPSREVDHRIVLVDGARPTYRRPYRASAVDNEEINRQVAQLLQKGWIRQSKSPWSSGVVLAKKKDGSWRLCVDFRAVNDITVKDRFPLPRVDDILDCVGNATIFSKIDLQMGYHQVRMAEESVEVTAFGTATGHWEWLVLPFGLCNAPPTFQRLMNSVFTEELMKFVGVFLDDVLVFSGSIEEHVEHLRVVLSRLREQRLFAKRAKCVFAQPVVEFCGFQLSKDGVSTTPDKVNAVRGWKVPTDLKSLRTWLGFVGYYQRFVDGFNVLTAPLTNLLKKDSRWVWESCHQDAFERVNRAIIEAPVLAFPDATKKYHLFVDASDLGIGACLEEEVPGLGPLPPESRLPSRSVGLRAKLMQERGGVLRPVAFRSRKFGKHELNYPVHEKELCAIVDTAELEALLKWFGCGTTY